MSFHFDEARDSAEHVLTAWLVDANSVTAALLVADFFGKIRLLLWSNQDIGVEALAAALSSKCGEWWSGDVLVVAPGEEDAARLYYSVWKTGRKSLVDTRLAVVDRHRNRSGWFNDTSQAVWLAPQDGPAVIVFYSFKGGFGRSTTLAAFAIQRARAGERVCVLDFDLDSPGVGLLLNHDGEGGTAQWGVVDFLIEHATASLQLSDYYHHCNRVAGDGEIVVFPAGIVNESYVSKLARIDFDEDAGAAESGINALLHRVRDELRPQWILIDSRTGISESAGQLLSGIAHLHVLLGTVQEQSWRGLGVLLDHVGKRRVLADREQAEVVLVQALVPAGEAGKLARLSFQARSESEFTERYYLEAGQEGGDSLWDTGDIDSLDAPHVPIALEYDARLAAFDDVSEVADILCGIPYSNLGERLVGRFVRESTHE